MELDSKSKNKYIKDVFKDCQISAEVKDGKIQVTSSAKDNKFVYISNMYQENNHVRRFLLLLISMFPTPTALIS